MTKFIGRATITYDGKTLATMPGASIDLGGWERKEIVLADGTVGYSDVPKAAEVECEVPISEDTPLEEIRNIVGATVTFRTDVGKTYMVRNAFHKPTPKFSAKDGGGNKVVFGGNPAEPV